MLWVNHAPGLRAIGSSSVEFYREVWIELSQFIRSLRRESEDWAQAVPPLANLFAEANVSQSAMTSN
jgi:hypothetical protein